MRELVQSSFPIGKNEEKVNASSSTGEYAMQDGPTVGSDRVRARHIHMILGNVPSGPTPARAWEGWIVIQSVSQSVSHSLSMSCAGASFSVVFSFFLPVSARQASRAVAGPILSKQPNERPSSLMVTELDDGPSSRGKVPDFVRRTQRTCKPQV
jgi:hypothetical protein